VVSALLWFQQKRLAMRNEKGSKVGIAAGDVAERLKAAVC
jgi:hypothetical protein